MWNNLEHLLFTDLKKHKLQDVDLYLVAVSGGLDSLTLVRMLHKVKPLSRLVLMHFHHGKASTLESQSYRDESFKYIQSLESLSIKVEFEISDQTLSSEDDYRQARLVFFQKTLEKNNSKFYLTAHHRDDVLETQLLKLIRGSGLDSLSAFKKWNHKIYRPFLDFSKIDLIKYASDEKLQWFEDPTNLLDQYNRNWIRNNWLKQLEEKIPGSKLNLARSLENITSEFENKSDIFQQEIARYIIFDGNEVVILRSWFTGLDASFQMKVLAYILRTEFKIEFSQGQIKEALKQLDKNQNDHIFKVAGIIWLTNRNNIVLK